MLSSIHRAVLAAWGLEETDPVELTSGHINQTYRLTSGTEDFILQRLNPIFGAEVHVDIDAITGRLESEGILTPRLVPTRSGELWTEDEEGGVWRLQTFMTGQTHPAALSPEMCESAGELVARFHGALFGWKHDFAHRRFGVHDTASHIATLEKALEEHGAHEAYREVDTLAKRVLAELRSLPELSSLPEHIVHGDLKLTNILFDEQQQAHVLIDLDTLAPMPLAHELGDALRSWCNRAGESAAAPQFDLEFFEASLRGYAQGGGGRLTREELASIPVGVETICLELTVRFLADALNESYFGWDSVAFPSASAHNFVRAQAQLQVAESFASRRSEAERVVTRVFSLVE